MIQTAVDTVYQRNVCFEAKKGIKSAHDSDFDGPETEAERLSYGP
jgi:hypothetical protein